jgi:predicted  nucleic acid-binding Zn-ribbon protein
MWKHLLDLLRNLLTLTRATEENRAEIKDPRQELRSLASAVERWAYELRRATDHEKHERENLALQLENELLRFERRLPAKHGKES